jgi:hypothetical protein
MNKVGFIILRHVNNSKTNSYWGHSYDCIRKYYPENEIMIIDDNSNYDFNRNKKNLYKTTIINSEYAGRGELLPYYYYLHNKLFDTAVIIHDSVFINSHIDFTVEKYKIIWDFKHNWDQIKDETKMIKSFNDKKLLEFYKNKSLWTGCFGGMSIITHDYLSFINSKYDISKLLDHVKTRFNRMSFERVIACLLQCNEQAEILLEDIHVYIAGAPIFDKKKINLHPGWERLSTLSHLPIIKIWTGR